MPTEGSSDAVKWFRRGWFRGSLVIVLAGLSVLFGLCVSVPAKPPQIALGSEAFLRLELATGAFFAVLFFAVSTLKAFEGQLPMELGKGGARWEELADTAGSTRAALGDLRKDLDEQARLIQTVIGPRLDALEKEVRQHGQDG